MAMPAGFQVYAESIREAVAGLYGIRLGDVELEPPSDPTFGDAASNVALRLAKELKQPPRAVAASIAGWIEAHRPASLASVAVAGPGFLNFSATPEAQAAELGQVLAEGPAYGRSAMGSGIKVIVEHCSANPTGPLHVAHGRQAAVGDSLASILDFAGYAVTREFYVNDTGNQIDNLGRAILWRGLEARGAAFAAEERPGEDGKPETWLVAQADGVRHAFPEKNLYRGDYVKTLAAELAAEGGPVDLDRARRHGVKRLLAEIRADLERFRVRFDSWQSEEELHRSGKVDEVLNFLTSWGLTYPKDGATYAKFQEYGDTEDRPLVKRDGGFVYRLPDIAYHRDKFARGFAVAIDLWGPDHHAHIANVAAGLRMLNHRLVPRGQVPAGGGAGLPPDQRPLAFDVLLIQHCRLLQNGQEVKMSKRAASYVTLRELMEEVGVDATRFFFAMRKPSSPLDFDLDVAKKKSLENPVYYAQYAHARIAAIVRKGLEEGKIPAAEVRDGTWRGAWEAARLGPDEIDLVKVLRQFRRRVEIAARDLDPAVLCDYLKELSGAYQRYYDLGNRDAGRRVLHEDEGVRRVKLAASTAVQQVLRNGFGLLGLSAPEAM
jgi:arginyl-tRNA synthetase